MPRVNKVNKAAKDYPEAGIQRGEPYFWFKRRHGPKVRSKTHPKRWQLTGSAFLSELWQLEDSISESTFHDWEDVENLVGEIENLKDQCEESLDNMPDTLRDTSDSGEMLQERIDALEDWISELLSLENEWEELEEDDRTVRVQETGSGL